MLSLKLAERFVKQISTYTPYNINIMDDKGIIIASRDSNRIGQFHETAYQMLRTQLEIGIIDSSDSYLGVKEGVNLLVSDGKAPVGVVGVTGPPDKVQEIALIIKMALETMIRYEVQQETSFHARTTHERLYLSLFMDESPNQATLEKQARQLHFLPRRMRVPVLIRYGEDTDLLLELTHLQSFLAAQDMCWIHDTCYIILFLAVPEGPAALSEWRTFVSEWLETLSAHVNYARVYVGVPQDRLYYYRTGLKHCLWLDKNCVSQSAILFFLDHLSQYIATLIPTIELHGIYNAFAHSLSQEEIQSILQIVEPLTQSNFNLVIASKRLFIHKNTLAFRINKLRDQFRIDPIHSTEDRVFLEYLCKYLAQKAIASKN